ncbi:TIGR04283 family arsenosugar biosynthesis glycosyltransferase [Opitutus terrae]|nr:TIGR04283 family arsenosugar biosynthesis glycosyltransferase [Opitutus terrae]
MLKFPRPGTVKTRLVPALGAHRACELYCSLVRHTLTEVERFKASAEVAVEARLTDAPDEAAARAWLGGDIVIRDQDDGDLGQRMDRAVQVAFAEGAETVAVIGGDCPQLTDRHLASAFAALEQAEAVIGPAADGGYYLIGLRRPLPTLFRGVSWGGADVLAQTLANARAFAIEISQLATLRDLDVPDDLPLWTQTPVARAAGRGGVSVVIPTLNEQEQLPATLAAARREHPHEIIVTDGGSTDRTLEIARRHDALVLEGSAGRARQMNRGAAVATGEYLLFLHADTVLPAIYPSLVKTTLARPGVVGGAFRFAVSGEFLGRRLIERGTNWRARYRQLPYGDQGIFVRADTFAQLGGYADLPIMEDYEFVQRLRRFGRLALAPAAALTSGRRWRELGPLRTLLVNQLVILGYCLGVSPVRLADWYHRPRSWRTFRPTRPGNKVPVTTSLFPE